MIAQIARLEEIEVHWSIVDLLAAHEALDIQELAERQAIAKAQSRGR